MALTEVGTTKSAQHTEVIATLLAINKQLRNAKEKLISSLMDGVWIIIELYGHQNRKTLTSR